jgi:GNAT superfamily N-acetyltransferase
LINEVPSVAIEAYAAAFPGPHAAMVVASIAAGNTAAQLWEATQPAGGAALLLWDQGNNVFYLAGDTIAEATRRDIAALIASHIRPAALARGRAYFKTHGFSRPSEDALTQIFGTVALREASTLFYVCTNVEPSALAAPPVEGIHFAQIDRALLVGDSLRNIAHVRSEIGWMWPSEERFYERGLGVAALVEEQLICWCTAEYVSADRCGIGIATDPAYERRGIATATAARFVLEAQRRGIAPYWECGSWNSASIRVAEKVGFARIAEERYWIGTFEE